MNRSRSVILERHKTIAEELKRNGTMSVRELSDLLHVTEMTIRRDLAALEEAGILRRVHGGAEYLFPDFKKDLDSASQPIANDTLELFSNVFSRIHRNIDLKRRIGAYAAKLVDNGEIIFLNSGTTCLYLLPHFAGKRVRIVSNNATISMLSRPMDIELTITGGEHYVWTQSFVGPAAKQVISNVISTKCFLGVSGISATGGITCSCFQETEINNLMIHQCRGKIIVIADGSKVGTCESFITCKVQDVDMLITDESADEAEIERLRACGLEVIIVSE